MNKKDIELWNTGIVNPKHTKRFIHYFCGAVLHECEYARNNDFDKACDKIFDTLYRVSHNNSDIGITTITYKDNLLEYLFNQKNEIPGYISYWLQCCYYNLLGKASEYEKRHFDVYTDLQRMYIEQYRNRKYGEKDERKFIKETRRKLCKMFRSGKYANAFKMYNTSFLDNITEQELEDISILITNLFPKELSDCHDSGRTAAVGYIIGKLGATKLQ